MNALLLLVVTDKLHAPPELGCTVLALERLFSCMRDHVRFQVARVPVFIGTPCYLTSPPLFGVCPLVFFEVTRVSKTFATFCFGAVMHKYSRVGWCMSSQLAFEGKSFSASVAY